VKRNLACDCVFVVIFAVASEGSLMETEPRAKPTTKFINVSWS